MMHRKKGMMKKAPMVFPGSGVIMVMGNSSQTTFGREPPVFRTALPGDGWVVIVQCRCPLRMTVDVMHREYVRWERNEVGHEKTSIEGRIYK